MEEGRLVHHVDETQLHRHPLGLGALAAEGFALVTDERPLEARVEQVHVHPVGRQPAFATLDEAKLAFASTPVYPDTTDPLYVGDAVAGGDIRIGAEILCRAALADEFATASGKYFDNDSGQFASPHPDALDSRKCQEIARAIETVLPEMMPL